MRMIPVLETSQTPSNSTTPSKSITIDPDHVNLASVTCGAGDLLTSGGFSNGSPADDGFLFFSVVQPRPPGGASWQVSVYNNDPRNPHTAQITAVCITAA